MHINVILGVFILKNAHALEPHQQAPHILQALKSFDHPDTLVSLLHTLFLRNKNIYVSYYTYIWSICQIKFLLEGKF